MTDWESLYREKKATGAYCFAPGCTRLLYPTGSPQFCDDHKIEIKPSRDNAEGGHAGAPADQQQRELFER